MTTNELVKQFRDLSGNSDTIYVHDETYLTITPRQNNILQVILTDGDKHVNKGYGFSVSGDGRINAYAVYNKTVRRWLFGDEYKEKCLIALIDFLKVANLKFAK